MDRRDPPAKARDGLVPVFPDSEFSMRILLALALTAALPNLTQAQVTINPKVGISLADMKEATQDLDTKGRMGYQAGVDLRLGGTVFLQPGLHWQQTGLEFTPVVGPVYTLDVRGMHLPVLLGVRMGTGLVGFRIVGGPTMTLVQSVKDNAGLVTKDDLTSQQFGGMAGLGVDLMGLSVDLTGEMGFTNYFEVAGDQKLRVFRLSAGLRF